MKVKVYGERNCGTNYLVQLLKLNFKDYVYDWDGIDHPVFYKFEFLKDIQFLFTNWYNLGWKHKAIDQSIFDSSIMDRSDLRVVCITKNPYAFLLSLYKRPYHYKGEIPKTFNSFISSPWKLRRRDNLKVMELDSPIQLWNKKVNSYLQLKRKHQDKVFLIKYESLLENPEETLENLSKVYGLRKLPEFRNIHSSTKGDDMTYFNYRNYYLNKEWLPDLSSVDIDLINKGLDEQLLSLLSYELL